MEEKKFEKLIKDLNSLRKIEAPDNFEFRLQTKLQNSESTDSESIKRSNKIIPVFALASVIILVFIIYRPFVDDYEDPFQIQPQVREDIVEYYESDNNLQLKDLINDSFIENDSNSLNNTSKQSDNKQNVSPDFSERNYSAFQYQFTISKEDLNFTRPVMNDEEVKQVQLLKQKLMSKKN